MEKTVENGLNFLVKNGLKFKTEPWEHQEKALQYLMQKEKAGLYTVCGSGKSKIILDMIVNKNFQKILIVCTNKACQNKVWETQIALHTYIPENTILNLTGKKVVDSVNQLKAYNWKQPAIVICNYERIWRGKLGDWFIRNICKFDCIVCDESHKIKTPSSKVSRFLSRLGARVSNKYLVTGTPSADSPLDIYAQYRFLDPTIFGTNYTRFKEQYLNIDPYLSARCGYPVLDKQNPYKNLDILRKKMFSCAFLTDSVVKLPPVRMIDYPFFMSEKLDKLYQKLDNEGAINKGDKFCTAENVLVEILRKQQLTGGYLHLEDYDGNKTTERVSTQRRNILLYWFEKIPKTEPIVVFGRFKKDLYSIKKVAERSGRTYSELSGNVDTLSEWQAEKTNVLVVQISSGAESIELTRAHYCIYYSLTHSLATYSQSLERVHRPGQKNEVLYIRLYAKSKLVKSTIDEDIIFCLDRKQSITEYLMEKKTV